MAATSQSWKNLPFTEGVMIPYQASFDAAQFLRMTNGWIPESADDAWFIYYDEPHLFFHWSWTGRAVFRVTLKRTSNGAEIAETLWSKKLAEISRSGPEYQVQLVDALIANRLLGQERPYPRPPRTAKPQLETFEESWAYTIRFVEGMPAHNSGWTPWTQFLLPMLHRCTGLGLDHYFRAGQSVSDIIISTSEKHGLEHYSPSPPRVTIRFEHEKKQWFIAWSHYGLFSRPPERQVAIHAETAFAALCRSLVDLWSETHPNEPLPKPLAGGGLEV